MTGKRSFLIVEKSRTGSMIGRLRNAASTMLCVGDSIARVMIGRISKSVRGIQGARYCQLDLPSLNSFLEQLLVI
jgi:hypothetical protein